MAPLSFIKLWGKFIPNDPTTLFHKTNHVQQEQQQQQIIIITPNTTKRLKKSTDNNTTTNKTDSNNKHDHFSRYIRAVPCVLGRVSKQNSTTISNLPDGTIAEEFVDLGSSNKISRLHALITFNDNSGFFYIQPIQNNVIKIRNKIITEPTALTSSDPIRIGNACFYVLFPEFEKPKKSVADLCCEILEHEAKSLPSKKITQRLIRTYPYLNAHYGNSQKFLPYSKACQNAMAHCEKIISLPVTTEQHKKRVRVEYILKDVHERNQTQLLQQQQQQQQQQQPQIEQSSEQQQQVDGEVIINNPPQPPLESTEGNEQLSPLVLKRSTIETSILTNEPLSLNDTSTSL
jgi:hypothetical protein